MEFITNKRNQRVFFILAVVLVFALIAVAHIRTGVYNQTERTLSLHGEELAGGTAASSGQPEDASKTSNAAVTLAARTDTWTKIFDPEQVGLETADYQAYIYDMTVTNLSDAVLSGYRVDLCFGTDAYMASAWNGSVIIHQDGTDDFIEDLRSFDASSLSVETFRVETEYFIRLDADDSLTYTPNTSISNPEVPIQPGETSVPGFIVYLKIGDTIDNAELVLTYQLQKSVLSDPLLAAAIVVAAVTFLLAILCLVTAYQRRRFEEIHQHDKMIVNESIETFTSFIDAKDPYTNGHSHRVAEYTKCIAGKLGYQGDELERIYYIALLHDSGKIGVADSILGKPDKLTPEEYNEIKKHTTLGGEILKNFKSIEGVTEGAMYHHERYDGKGYPEGRKGTDIPRIARIICVADSFDAMNSNRCYRKRLSREKILDEIESNKGKQFDPEVAEVMLKLIESGEIKL